MKTGIIQSLPHVKGTTLDWPNYNCTRPRDAACARVHVTQTFRQLTTSSEESIKAASSGVRAHGRRTELTHQAHFLTALGTTVLSPGLLVLRSGGSRQGL